VKFEVLESFEADYQRLSASERRLFKEVLPEFVAACDRFAADPSIPWPMSLRVKAIEGARGVMEMTWSFAGPDGRATFERIKIDGSLALRWRRVGGHRVFKNP
jgi:hypothetical protein